MNEVKIFKRVNENAEKKTPSILRLPTKQDIAPSLLMLFSARANIMGMFPFGMAFFASVYDKKTAYLGMVCAAAGLLSMGVGGQTIKYMFAMVLFWLYTRIREDYKQHSIISSIVCGSSILLGGIATLTFINVTGFDVIMLFAESVITAFMYVVFEHSQPLLTASRHKLSQEEIICFCMSIAVMIMGFSKIVLPFGISVTKLLSAYGVMLLAMNTSLAAAGSGALAAGMICGVNNANISGLMGVYGLCGIVGNMLKTFGKYGVMIGFLASCAVIMLCEGTSLNMPINIAEIVGAGFIFVITPNSIHNKISTFFSKSTADNSNDIGERVKKYLSIKLKSTSAAFSHLADSFNSITDKNINTADVSVIFDNTADRVCKHCSMAVHCWQKGFDNTYKDMLSMLAIIEEKGSIELSDLPDDFPDHCVKAEKLIANFTHMYEIYREKVMKMGEMALNRELIAGQYREISNIMEQFSLDVEEGFDFMTEHEKQITEELDKVGIIARDVCITAYSGKNMAVSLNLFGDYDVDEVCDTVSDIMGVPMIKDSNYSGQYLRLITRCSTELDIGMAQISRTGESDNGDSIINLTTEDHKFVLAISDGMGSGTKAKEESKLTTELLSDFIQAGFDKISGINMINSSLALRSDRETFSTLDLLVVDKNTRIAEFIKAGAPESYIMSDGEIETVFSMSLPAGMLSDTDADMQKRTLKSGDLIVMMSDGVSDAGKSLVRGEWIKKMMMSGSVNSQDLADKILQGALARSHSLAGDDMSVAVVRII